MSEVQVREQAPRPAGGDATAAGRSFATDAAAQMERMLADFGSMYQERNQALQEVTGAHQGALMLLARAAEYRDDDTGVHIVRLGFLAWAMALCLGESRGFAALLRQAAPMHDLGKIGVADAVLKKPGALTHHERASMREHPRIGADIIGASRIPLFQLASQAALTHHERWDGAGYPHGLRGKAIPLAGRIVAVVDFFDALTMDRCYRPAFSYQVALDMLQAESGKAFDPAVVACFMAHAPQLIALREEVTAAGSGFEALVHEPPRLAAAAAFLNRGRRDAM